MLLTWSMGEIFFETGSVLFGIAEVALKQVVVERVFVVQPALRDHAFPVEDAGQLTAQR